VVGLVDAKPLIRANGRDEYLAYKGDGLDSEFSQDSHEISETQRLTPFNRSL